MSDTASTASAVISQFAGVSVAAQGIPGRAFRTTRVYLAGLAFMIVIVACALFAPWLAACTTRSSSTATSC